MDLGATEVDGSARPGRGAILKRSHDLLAFTLPVDKTASDPAELMNSITSRQHPVGQPIPGRVEEWLVGSRTGAVAP